MTGRFVLIAVAACGLVGCSSVDLQSLPLPMMAEEKPKELPAKMIPVWADTVLHRGGKAVRGFGGRVIFYGPKNDTPIDVDGSLIVYAWDDTNGAASEKPDRKYAFLAEDLPKHYSPSKIGHSYSFWLPWDEVNGETQHVTLVTRFIDAKGGEVTSSAAHVVLPGPYEKETEEPSEPEKLAASLRKKIELMSETESSSGIQQLGFERSAPRQEREPNQFSSTTTIDLPLHLAHGHDIVDLSAEADRERKSISARDLISAPAPAESASAVRHAGRFSPRELPVQSWRSGPQFSSRESSQRARSMSRSDQNRLQRSQTMSVQQRIVRDAAEAKARRVEQQSRGEDAALERE